MWEQIQQIMPYAVAYSMPLLITALGGLYAERSGVTNIGLDGIMIIGTLFSALTIVALYPTMGEAAIWLGLLSSLIAGGVFSLLHAFASVTLNANQVISGTAINMIAGSLAHYIARLFSGSGSVTIERGFLRYDVPVLSNIPIIGKLFFSNVYHSTWLVLGILGISWFVIYKTRFGLRLRACGENPHAADAVGINVYKIRYIAVLISGAFAGLGGGIFLVTYAGESNGSVGGIGFLALAALIFGQWKVFGILGTTLFFGLFATIANVSLIMPSLQSIPPVLLKSFPYIITLLALVVFSKSSQAPRASGEPFDKGKR